MANTIKPPDGPSAANGAAAAEASDQLDAAQQAKIATDFSAYQASHPLDAQLDRLEALDPRLAETLRGGA